MSPTDVDARSLSPLKHHFFQIFESLARHGAPVIYHKFVGKIYFNQTLFLCSGITVFSLGRTRSYLSGFFSIFGPGHFRSIWLAMVRFLTFILNWPIRGLLSSSSRVKWLGKALEDPFTENELCNMFCQLDIFRLILSTNNILCCVLVVRFFAKKRRTFVRLCRG